MRVLFILFVWGTTIPGCASSWLNAGPPIRVAVQTEPLQVKEIPLERYVIGVVSAEMSPDWPLEALKAQAVASRGFALYRRRHPRSPSYDLEANVQDQVFSESSDHSSLVIEAVKGTRGEVLAYQGKIFSPFFHSTCGGLSESAASVWKGSEPFPSPLTEIHEDSFCEESPRYRWSYEATREETGGDIQILDRSETGRITDLLVLSDDAQTEFSGNQFREKIGFDKIRSTLFEIEELGGKIVFNGKGSGHGVGLCQWGAKGMAEKGHTYREILEFYYPGATLANLPL